MFTKIEGRKVWVNTEKTIFIWLPCDKKTYRVVTQNGESLLSGTFRTLEAAVKASLRITA